MKVEKKVYIRGIYKENAQFVRERNDRVMEIRQRRDKG